MFRFLSTQLLWKTSLEDASVGLVIFDKRHEIIYFNSKAASLLEDNHKQTNKKISSHFAMRLTALLNRSVKQAGAAESLTAPNSLSPTVHKIALPNTFQGGACFVSFQKLSIFRFTFWLARISDQPPIPVLADERDELILALEKSRDSSLNIMEDLARQKKDLENSNLMLENEIARRKISEQSRSRLADIVESSDDAIFSKTVAGVITSWNYGAQLMYGYQPQEIIGKNVSILTSSNETPEATELRETIQPEKLSERFQAVHKTKSAERIHVSITMSPIFDAQGAVVEMSVIGRDISKRVYIEEELANYRQHLELLVEERTSQLVKTQEVARQSERLASLGALAAGIAHEINNPIGAILLSAQNALEMRPELKEVETMGKALENLSLKAISNAQRCGLIVKGILQFSRNQSAERWLCDINSIVKNSVQLVMESTSRKNVSVRLDLALELPKINVNPVEIEQVVVNLVKNACESSDTEIQVSVSSAKTDRNSIVICVEDNGIGIPLDLREHIFDPFFTTRLNKGGTGLGLSIVHGIVTNYGGTITLDDTLKKGTKITVEIPIASNAETASSAAGPD